MKAQTETILHYRLYDETPNLSEIEKRQRREKLMRDLGENGWQCDWHPHESVRGKLAWIYDSYEGRNIGKIAGDTLTIFEANYRIRQFLEDYSLKE